VNFENAIRNKYRFVCRLGNLGVEDLWDLPLTTAKADGSSLNNIAKELSRQLKAESEEDFVSTKSSINKELQEKLDIVIYVIKVRKEENEALRNAADKTAKKAKLLEVLARKQDQAIESMSEEDIQAARRLWIESVDDEIKGLLDTVEVTE